MNACEHNYFKPESSQIGFRLFYCLCDQPHKFYRENSLSSCFQRMREIQKMYFYQEETQIIQYISEHELWVLGRVSGIYNKTTNKSEEMLEPLWRKYDQSIEGILIFIQRWKRQFTLFI